MRTALCIVISLAAVLDVVTTWLVLRLGGREANPLLQRLFRLANPIAVMVVLHGALLLWLWRSVGELQIATLLVIAMAWWIVVVWNARNVWALWRALRAEILISP